MAAGKKRVATDDAVSQPKSKRAKVAPDSTPPKSSKPSGILTAEEIDFPRGGGSVFTPAEYKAIRSEAAKEADDELKFHDSQATRKAKRKTNSPAKPSKNSKGKQKDADDSNDKSDTIRVEHLNYKRVVPGMRLLCQVTHVLPLGLVVSLPNQLLGHIPVTRISKELTARLDAVDDNDEDASDDESAAGPSSLPELTEMFRIGQFLTAVVSTVHATGSSVDPMLKRGDIDRASHRVELCLVPEEVNEGFSKRDLGPGVVLTASIKTVEDHGYTLNLGIADASGFLSFKDAKKGTHELNAKRLPVGMVFQVAITKKSDNGRIYTASIDPSSLKSAAVTELSTATSVLPGILVSGLVTAVLPAGLNIQILGYFDGSVDQYHLPHSDGPKLGDKIKARVLWEVTAASPRRFALSVLPHIIELARATVGATQSLRDAFPTGMLLEGVKVTEVLPEHGLVCNIQDNLSAFVHISQVSDEHLNSLSATSGNWKVGTTHRARVIGYSDLDGIVQLSLKQSILDQKFMSVADVTVGERMKGTVKNLADNALFVSVSGSVDAVVWPNHYADIKLRHPEKRFKPGGSVHARVLVVDASRNRLCLTLKKTLVESELPIIASVDDAKPGTITHAVIFKNLDKGVLVEFFNGIRAIIPQREMNDSAVQSTDDFPVGKVVRVKILESDPENRKIVASIRQGAANFASAIDISGVEDGSIVAGAISALHKDHAVLSLKPSKVRALLAYAHIAKHRDLPLAQAKASLKVGESISGLTVVSRNAEKGFVLVSYGQPKSEKRDRRLSISGNNTLAIESISQGQVVSGLVVSHGRKGAVVRISSKISGSVHPLDVSDEYPTKSKLPPTSSTLNFAVIAIDQRRKQLTLSTRPSRVTPDTAPVVVDKEIAGIEDVKVGQKIRGFVKSISDHGIFVTIGRNLDARVQIKELFDDFVKEWQSRFEVDMRVEGRLTGVDIDKHQVEMSLRSGSKSAAAAVASRPLSDFSKGDKVDALVKRIETFGIFLEIEGTKVSGLCHKSNISDGKESDVARAMKNFSPGDRVKAAVLKVDLEKRRIDFGLKPSLFNAEDFAEPVAEDNEDDDDKLSVADSGGDDALGDDANGVEEDSDDDEEVVQIDGMDIDEPAAPSVSITEPTTSALRIGGFNWNPSAVTNPADDLSSHDSSSEEKVVRKKKRKHEIQHDLTADMHTRAPESTADFERLLLGSPNSSYLWVQYMSFQLQLSEIEKAREVGRRALKVINFREEQEKLNVWIALLNLENLHGTTETLDALFKDAVKHNDSKTIYLRMAAIFEQTGKVLQAEEQHQKTCKKFGKSSKVWTLFAEYYLRNGRSEDASKLLPRALQSLEKRKHLKTISKFAQLEYCLGDPERGRTIFEGIVNSHPKRYDLWFVYLDMEAKQQNIGGLRFVQTKQWGKVCGIYSDFAPRRLRAFRFSASLNLFERVLSGKLSLHKAKAFFKKWLELEKRIGDEAGQMAVKEKAVAWKSMHE